MQSMSVSDYKEISTVDDDEDDDDRDRGERRNQQMVKTQKINGFSFPSNLGKKAKSFVLRPFRKKKPLILNRGASSSSSSSCFSGNNVSSDRGIGCYLCFKKSSVMESDSSVGSPISDPNDPNFTFDMLRVLIERNDFRCEHCNTHLDPDDDCGD